MDGFDDFDYYEEHNRKHERQGFTAKEFIVLLLAGWLGYLAASALATYLGV